MKSVEKKNAQAGGQENAETESLPPETPTGGNFWSYEDSLEKWGKPRCPMRI